MSNQPSCGSTRPWVACPTAVNVGLNASRNPYVENTFAPYLSRIAQSAGRAISGANGMDPPAAVGAIVPSSSRSVNDAPRAQ